MDWNNKQEVLEAVKQKGWALENASEDLRKDRDVVLEAVKQYGEALKYASKDLRKDREVVIEAVRQSGEFLEYASKQLKKDKKFILEAVKITGLAFRYASEELQNNRSFVLEVINENDFAFRYASEELKNDKVVRLFLTYMDFRDAQDIFKSLDLSLFDGSEENNKVIDVFLDKTKKMMKSHFENNNKYVSECKDVIEQVNQILEEKKKEYDDKKMVEEPLVSDESLRKADLDKILEKLGKIGKQNIAKNRKQNIGKDGKGGK